ncbi:hypothetical protein BD289DRAFT_212225 [Coniella lustricola]|uniref:Uncharacterized protein n=1 Tax=Coniella lustricola TaxID=2025994 RepID=A0A2T3ABI5_9PEZI|nr:hypothetical protein BD289DRAFT_212225 [Coniella lustricola]
MALGMPLRTSLLLCCAKRTSKTAHHGHLALKDSAVLSQHPQRESHRFLVVHISCSLIGNWSHSTTLLRPDRVLYIRGSTSGHLAPPHVRQSYESLMSRYLLYWLKSLHLFLSGPVSIKIASPYFDAE